MSSLAEIQALDAMMTDAFVANGLLADAGQYIDADDNMVDVTVMIDRAMQRIGEFGQVVGTDTGVWFQLAECTPARGGTLFVSPETFKLDRKIEADGSMELWSVTS